MQNLKENILFVARRTVRRARRLNVIVEKLRLYFQDNSALYTTLHVNSLNGEALENWRCCRYRCGARRSRADLRAHQDRAVQDDGLQLEHLDAKLHGPRAADRC